MAIGVAVWTTATARPSPIRTWSSSGKRRAPPDVPAALRMRDHVVDRVVHGPRGCPAGQLAEQARVRLAAAELLEAVLVGLLVGHEADAGAGARPLDDRAGELEDGDRGLGADVEHLAERAV